MKNKFKVGDTVIFVSRQRHDEYKHRNYEEGKTYTIRNIYPEGQIYVHGFSGEHALEYQLEFPEVYDTPLMKALR